MNLNEIEGAVFSKREKTKSTDVHRDKNLGHINQSEEMVECEQSRPFEKNWRFLIKLVGGACLLLGILIGYFVGSVVYSNAETTSFPQSIYSLLDYTQYNVNDAMGVTVQSFYKSDEERFYASQLIGTRLPSIPYTRQDGVVVNTDEIDGDEYIIEFFEYDCAYCNNMIDVVDEYRASNNSVKIISLSTDQPSKDKKIDISRFNMYGENAFIIGSRTDAVEAFLNKIPFIPAFVFVKCGVIKLITFGELTKEDIDENRLIAFGQSSQ